MVNILIMLNSQNTGHSLKRAAPNRPQGRFCGLEGSLIRKFVPEMSRNPPLNNYKCRRQARHMKKLTT